MLQEIITNLKSQITDILPQEHLSQGVSHEDVAQTAGESVVQHLTEATGNGDFSAVREMFSGEETAENHPVMANMMPSVISNLTNKLGIDQAQAGNIAQSILPKVMNMFNHKVGSGSGFDIQSIISQFTSGNSGIGGMIKNFFGGNDSTP